MMTASRIAASFLRRMASCCVVMYMFLATSEAVFSGSGDSTGRTGVGTVPNPAACPDVCMCPLEPGRRVRCFGDESVETISFYNFGLIEIPDFNGVFSNLSTIDLSSNFLIDIPRGTFNGDSFPSLAEVDLSYNLLQVVRLSAFDIGGDNFQILNLRDNLIESILLGGTQLNRENYPALTISLGGNPLRCDATNPERLQTSSYVPLCRDNFIENDGATCVHPNNMPITLTRYCETVLDALQQIEPPRTTNQPPPATTEPPPETREPPPETREPPPETRAPSTNGGQEFSGGGTSQGVIIGASVATFTIILMVLITVLLIVCLCLRFKMWERKADTVAMNQIEERLLNNKLNAKPHDLEYNKFLPLNAQSGSGLSPRYVSIPNSPLPPIPGYPPGFPAPIFPGRGGGGFPKLQEEVRDPNSEDIYESIDESLFEEYESSYIYRVESVPERPASMTKNVPLPQAPTKVTIKEPISSDQESDAASATVVEAVIFVNHAANIDASSRQTVIEAEVHTGAVTPEKQSCEKVTGPGTAPPIAEGEMDQKPLSIETKVDIEGIEEVQTANIANQGSDEVSAPKESSGSAAKQNQNQEVTPSVDCSDSCTPMTTIVNADDKDDATEMAQNGDTAEHNKRLSALKDAWASQDKEDVAYLKIVL